MTVKLHCHTNLDDVDRLEEWPRELPARPIVGDLIESRITWRNDARVVLEVVKTMWTFSENHGWMLDVELHLKTNGVHNITQFEIWYRYIQGQIPREQYCEEYARTQKRGPHDY